MCLTRVYLREDGKDKALVEEAASVEANGMDVEIYTIFGENMTVDSCFIKEVNMVENYMILSRKEVADGETG
ncbi:MAG: CooT family nickel-binding protein [Deltaproteobacteria bacterium]|nr:CooT family nickel-binding protein [Deltaproteobacteria bacterium]